MRHTERERERDSEKERNMQRKRHPERQRQRQADRWTGSIQEGVKYAELEKKKEKEDYYLVRCCQ